MELDYSDLEFDEEKYFLGKLCKRGHDWNNTGASLRYARLDKRGYSNCVDCQRLRNKLRKTGSIIGHTKEYYEKEAIRLARERGGECLSEYVNSDTKQVFCCWCGHEWSAYLYMIRRGHWCPKCAGQVVDLDSILKSAKNKKIEILSEYKKSGDKINVKCSICGHKWKVLARALRVYGCPKCADAKRGGIKRTDSKIVKSYIEDNNGELLCIKYPNNVAEITRKCQCGNVITTGLKNTLINRGCCSHCLGESMKGEKHFGYISSIKNIEGKTRKQSWSHHYNRKNEIIEKRKKYFLRNYYWKGVVELINREEASDIVVVKAMGIMDEFTEFKLELNKLYREKKWEEYLMKVNQMIDEHGEHLSALLVGEVRHPQFLLKSINRAANTQLGVLREHRKEVVTNAWNHPNEIPTLIEL